MPDTYKGRWEHVCGESGVEVYFPRATINFCPYCGIPQIAPDEESRPPAPDIEWDIDGNFPVYTRDFLEWLGPQERAAVLENLRIMLANISKRGV